MIVKQEALARLSACADRAEAEEPSLAAPDGTVAVQWRDLRIALAALTERASATVEREEDVRAILWNHLGGDHRYTAIRQATSELLRLFSQPSSDAEVAK